MAGQGVAGLQALGALGTSPPTPAYIGNPSDRSGIINLGTGTSTAAGDLVNNWFGGSHAANDLRGYGPAVILTPLNLATYNLGLYVSYFDKFRFKISCVNAPTASQATNTYQIAFYCGGLE